MGNKVSYLPFTASILLTVFEEQAVSDAVDAAVAEYPFAEDVFDAAIWLLARNPDAGDVIDGTNPVQNLICIPSNRLAKSPTLLVRYFRKDEDSLMITWIKFLPFDESNAVTPDAYQL